MSAVPAIRSLTRATRSRWMSAVVLPFVAQLAGGCGAPEPRDPVEIDCSVVEQYEIDEPFMSFDNPTQAEWWFAFGDELPGFPPAEDAPEPLSEEIEDGGRCGSQRALVLRAYGHNFWGSGFGTWQFNNVNTARDGSGWDGLALWARSPGATDKGVFLNIDERRTAPADCGNGERGENEALVNNNEPECLRPDGYPIAEDERPDECFVEECDDGNSVPGDGCSPQCRHEECGNGVVDLGEGCDTGSVCFDGDESEGTPCTENDPCPGEQICRMAAQFCTGGEEPEGTTCGPGSDCREGGTCTWFQSETCTSDCRFPNCGDGVRDSGEQCDDGNNRDGDGCNALCSSDETCGNGYLDPGEECDDANSVDRDRCVECVSISCTTPTREPGDTTVVYRQDAEGNLVLASSAEVEPDECGNAFRRRLMTTRDWQLYLLPWDSFYQEAQNNRLPDGIDPSVILQFTVVVPRESNLELWLDDFAFYRNR